MIPEHADPYASWYGEEEKGNDVSFRNDDPNIIYSWAWWIANGIAPSQILAKKEDNIF